VLPTQLTLYYLTSVGRGGTPREKGQEVIILYDAHHRCSAIVSEITLSSPPHVRVDDYYDNNV